METEQDGQKDVGHYHIQKKKQRRHAQTETLDYLHGS